MGAGSLQAVSSSQPHAGLERIVLVKAHSSVSYRKSHCWCLELSCPDNTVLILSSTPLMAPATILNQPLDVRQTLVRAAERLYRPKLFLLFLKTK